MTWSVNEAPLKLLFYRDFQRYSGGHGKVRDYYDHTDAHPRWSAAVHLSPASVREHNPWFDRPARVESDWRPDSASALLLGGMDWLAYPRDHPSLPVINLVQGVRHADPGDVRHAFLSRPAVRICVSAPVADAILGSGLVRGPVQVIEAGLSIPVRDSGPLGRRGIVVDAVKQPRVGAALASRLSAAGHQVTLLEQRIARTVYLQLLAGSEIAVLLPGPSEGFYLPGLEAMALGCPAVVPDGGGNRAYLEPGTNALVPPMDAIALAAAVEQLHDVGLRARLVAAGRLTASRFTLDRERAAFHRVLDELDALWETARSG